MMFRTGALAALSLMLPIAMQSVPAQAQGPSRDHQRIACEADAQRLCGQFIPDEAQVSRCMVKSIRAVSPQCRRVMEASRKARGGR